MNMIEILKDEMNKSLNKIYENKPWKEMNKTVEGLNDVGCPSVCCEYVFLPLVNIEADLTSSQAE